MMATPPLPLVKVRDPRVNVLADDGRARVLRVGGQRITEQVIAAQSYGANQANWATQPPSPQVIVTRDWRVRWYVRITAQGAGNLGLRPGYDSLASWPIAAITQNLQLSLNGSSTSVQLNKIAPALLAFSGDAEEYRSRFHSTTAAQPDQAQSFADLHNSNRSPMAGFGDNTLEPSRGSFPAIPPWSTPPVGPVYPQTRDFVITEPLLISPLLSGERQDEGLAQLNQIALIVAFSSNLQTIWSHDDISAGRDPNFSGVAVSFTQAPELLFSYITPAPTQSIPPMISYEYHNPLIFYSSPQTLAPGAQATTTANSVQLSQVPRRSLIFVGRNNPSSLQTQSFCRIDALNVNFDNVAGLFATASAQQLFQMSAKNGIRRSWYEWTQGSGSVLAIDYGRDLGLSPDLAPGTQGLFNIQIQAQYTNINTRESFDAVLTVVHILEGSCVIVANGARFQLGDFTRAQVLDASQFGPELSPELHSILDSGGSFWSSLKSFVKRAAGGISQGAKFLAPAIAAINPALGAMAGTVGSVADTVHGLAGSGMSGGRMSGGRLRRSRY